MKIVIQCASGKISGAPRLTKKDGTPVLFVARPGIAPPSSTQVYAPPDDVSDDGRTWRQCLLDYNTNGTNPLKLLPAYRLYKNKIYRELVNKFGLPQVFILSAGWGLIPAAFLTPSYDITFSAMANKENKYKRRGKDDRYADFCMITDDGEDILFIGGKDYLPLFCELTAALKGAKFVFFNLETEPDLPQGFSLRRYRTTKKQNWHYECADALIDGEITLSQGQIDK